MICYIEIYVKYTHMTLGYFIHNHTQCVKGIKLGQFWSNFKVPVSHLLFVIEVKGLKPI